MSDFLALRGAQLEVERVKVSPVTPRPLVCYSRLPLLVLLPPLGSPVQKAIRTMCPSVAAPRELTLLVF